MDIPPGLKKFLEAIGVNTTRLQWRLHQWERRRAEPEKPRQLPSGLRWLQYKHKFCDGCGKIVDRDEKTCPFCGAQIRSAGASKALRAIGLAFPEGTGVISLFIAVMVALYAYSIFLGGPGAIMRPSMETLHRFGLMSPAMVSQGHYWRLLGFGLFHAGLIHIGFNCMGLIQIGPWVENEIGSKRMFVLITLTQLTSALAVQFFWPVGAVGASGWLYGLIGFGISYFHRFGKKDARNLFIQWAAYAMVFALVVRANHAAHLGGLVGGIAVGLTADLTRARRTPWTAVWDFLFWPCAAAWIYTLFCLAQSIRS